MTVEIVHYSWLLFYPTSAAAFSAQPDVGDLMSELPHYLTEMQSTIAVLAVAVAVVTIIAAFVGAGFTFFGFLEQRRAQREIADLREENRRRMAEFERDTKTFMRELHTQSMNDLNERHSLHKDEMRQLHENIEAHTQVAVAKMREEMMQSAERVGELYQKEFLHKMQTIETNYASDLKLIEDILMAFQEECASYDASGWQTFDFLRYNLFRHLLFRLVAGSRPDVHAALSRLLQEFAPSIGEYPGRLLRGLLGELQEAGRFSRADLRIIALRLMSELDRRFPPPDDAPQT